MKPIYVQLITLAMYAIFLVGLFYFYKKLILIAKKDIFDIRREVAN